MMKEKQFLWNIDFKMRDGYVSASISQNVLFFPSLIPIIELSRLLFVRIHLLQCLFDGLFVILKSSVPPSHLSILPFCWQQCGSAACWQRGFSFGQQNDSLCSAAIIFRASCPLRSEGVQPICDSKGQAHLDRCLHSGVPFFPEAPLLNTFTNTGNHSLFPTTICIPVNPGHVRNAFSIWNWGRRTKEQLDWFFCSRCHTY